MKFLKQSITGLSGLALVVFANASFALTQGQVPPATTPIPEPSILSLVVVGIIAVGLSRRKSRR